MKKNFKKVASIIAICILVLMYILSLVFAISNVPNWQRFFFASMGATIIFPSFLGLIIFLYDRMMERRKDGNDDEGSND